MRSLQNFNDQPAGVAILADDVLEFHAARLLLLFKVCGAVKRVDKLPRIEGLTKMAKLDFFVRYPEFFDEICQHLGAKSVVPSSLRPIESSMVRFHYGPWDKRYYHVLSYLEAKGLISVEQDGAMYVLKLTGSGNALAGSAETNPAFADLIQHMGRVKKVLGMKSGSALKDLVYKVFGEEVADRPLGEVIE